MPTRLTTGPTPLGNSRRLRHGGRGFSGLPTSDDEFSNWPSETFASGYKGFNIGATPRSMEYEDDDDLPIFAASEDTSIWGSAFACLLFTLGAIIAALIALAFATGGLCGCFDPVLRQR